MLPPCSYRCWPGPHDGGRSGARSLASRRSLCCEPLTRSSFCAPSAPSCCSVARCVCTRRGTDHDGRAAGDRDRGDVLLDERARDAPAGRLFAVARPQVPWVGPGCRADDARERDPRGLLGLALRASYRVFPVAATLHSGNLLPAVALLFSVGTLAVVLLGVEMLRLWVRRQIGR